MIVAQITDTHISTPDGEPERRFATSAHLARAVAHLNALPQAPDAVLLTGDLVDRGSPREYAILRELIAPLAMPVYMIPGNHDERRALGTAFAERGYFPADGFLQYTVEHLPVRLVALDTCLPGEVGGILCALRLAWLDERLAEQPARPTMILMHHPPLKTGIKQMDLWGLQNAEALGVIVARHPQVERIVCGHLHRPITWRWQGTVVSTCPATAHQFALDLGDEVRDIELVLEPPCCQLHLWRPELGLVTHTSYIGGFPAAPDI